MIPHLEGPMKMPFVRLGLNHLRAVISFVVYFALSTLLPTFGLLRTIKSERLKYRPLITLVTNCFGGRFFAEGTNNQRKH